MTIKITNILLKISFVLLIIIASLLVLAHIVVNIYGKALIVQKLEETFKQKAEIGSLTTSFPTTVRLKNIKVEGLFKIDETIAGGGLFDVFRKSFRLSSLKVIRPVVTLEEDLVHPIPQDVPIPVLIPRFIPFELDKKTDNKAATPNLNPMDIAKGSFLFPRFYINHFIISDGTFNFTDRSVGNGGITIKIDRLNMKVDNLNFTGSGSKMTSFQLKAKIPWQKGQEEGRIEAEGWLNFFKKNMEATLKIEDIDGVYLYPYYSHWVDLEKARIEKAKLNFTSNISGLNNNVTAQCRLELTDIVRRPRPEGELGEKAEKITDVVLDIFRALSQGKIVLDFTIRTKMDKPQFGFGDIKMAFEDKLAKGKKANGFKPEDALLIPAKLIEGLFKGTTDLTTAVISGTISAGKEIGKTVEGALKKEEKKEEKKE